MYKLITNYIGIKSIFICFDETSLSINNLLQTFGEALENPIDSYRLLRWMWLVALLTTPVLTL